MDCGRKGAERKGGSLFFFLLLASQLRPGTRRKTFPSNKNETTNTHFDVMDSSHRC